MSTTVALVSESNYMGVSCTLQGTVYWLSYLESIVADNTYDQATADEWEAKYDGYEMVWAFSNP